MRNILQLIIKYHLSFLFISLEIIALILIVTFNRNQHTLFLSSSTELSGSLFETTNSLEEYLDLDVINKNLAKENAELKSAILDYHTSNQHFTNDTTVNIQYKYKSGEVINNSTNRPFNYITINKGTEDGIKPDMGIISPNGVIGIIIKCSKHYSTALSLLNSRLKISARLKGSEFFGSVNWDRENPQTAILSEIPEHAIVNIGDTVITSGYSSTFPEGIKIGTVKDIKHPAGESFFKIRVKLSVDFSSLNYVEIIENTLRDEQIKLEEDSKL